MSALVDRLQARIVELSAYQGEIQARADKEKADAQTQINALLAAKAALTKDPAVEAVYLTLAALKLFPTKE